MNYRIVEENRQIWIEQLVKGKSWDSWVAVDKPNVPRYHPTVADARSWVETLRKGRVIHSVDDDGLQWFIDRVGKVVYGHYPNKSGIQEFPIIDADHARHLHTASVEMGYVYKDAPNIAQDERKPDDGVKPLEWFLERVGKPVVNSRGFHYIVTSSGIAKNLFDSQRKIENYSDPS